MLYNKKGLLLLVPFLLISSDGFAGKGDKRKRGDDKATRESGLRARSGSESTDVVQARLPGATDAISFFGPDPLPATFTSTIENLKVPVENICASVIIGYALDLMKQIVDRGLGQLVWVAG